MQLNWMICLKCRNDAFFGRNGKLPPPIDEDSLLWRCSISFGKSGEVHCEDPPPKKCPYKMEHLLTTQGQCDGE